MRKAKEIVDAVIDDLSDRRGLRHQWNLIDYNIKVEIREAWEEIVTKALAATPETSHCETCVCGKRAPVQASLPTHQKGPGTISWEEHLEAWHGYAARYGSSQTAERLAERGGFSYGDLLMFLKREPTTWQPVRS